MADVAPAISAANGPDPDYDWRRIAYQVMYQRHLSPTIPASATVPDGAPQATYVVVERQSEGNWLVALRAAGLDPVE